MRKIGDILQSLRITSACRYVPNDHPQTFWGKFNRFRYRLWGKARSFVPEGSVLPWWLIAIRFFIFPSDTLYCIVQIKDGYDPSRDTWTIEGLRYSPQFFRMLEDDVGIMVVITRKGSTILFERVSGLK